MTANATFRLELIGKRHARITYPLAVLSQPRLTLLQWQRQLRPRNTLYALPVIGVFNERNCAIAVLRRSRRGIKVLAAPPAFSMDLPALLEWLERTWPACLAIHPEGA
jgi:hypothetical protein